MHHGIGQLPVIGEQQQTLRVHIEPAHGIDPLPDAGDKRGNRRPSLLVMEGCNHTGRLVEHDGDKFLPLKNRPAIHQNIILRRVCLCSGDRRDAVHLHFAGSNQLLGRPAGHEP